MKRQEMAVIALTVVLFVIVGGVLLAIFGVYTDGFSRKYSPIYITSGNMQFFQDNDEPFELGNVQFKVHNAWTSNSRYTVQVLPTGEDFYYQVDGRWYSFLDIEDLTPAVDISIDGRRFVVRAKNMFLSNVISSLYGGKEVVIAADNVDLTPHYKLVVTSSNGKHYVFLTFCCELEYIHLDPSRVLF